MENTTVDSLALEGSVNYDLTIWGLFFQADIVVKLVLIILLFASFWTWAIIFEKLWRLRLLQRSATGFEDEFWSGGSLDELYERVGQKPELPRPIPTRSRTALRQCPAVIAYNKISSGSTVSATVAARVLGRSTFTPTVSNGAVTMKTISSTSMTSTKGVTFISAIGL